MLRSHLHSDHRLSFPLSLPSPDRVYAASWHTPAHHLVYPPQETAWRVKCKKKINKK